MLFRALHYKSKNRNQNANALFIVGTQLSHRPREERRKDFSKLCLHFPSLFRCMEKKALAAQSSRNRVKTMWKTHLCCFGNRSHGGGEKKETLLCQCTHSLLPVGNGPWQRGHLCLVGPGSGCAYSAAIAAERKLGTVSITIKPPVLRRQEEQGAAGSSVRFTYVRAVELHCFTGENHCLTALRGQDLNTPLNLTYI